MTIYQLRICRRDLQANPAVLYLFGDNNARWGYGGQAAAMRGEPNAVGIRTKRLPTSDRDAFLTDDDEIEARSWWREDLARVRDHVAAGGHVIAPLEGLGTGRAELSKRAPKLAAFLARELREALGAS